MLRDGKQCSQTARLSCPRAFAFAIAFAFSTVPSLPIPSDSCLNAATTTGRPSLTTLCKIPTCPTSALFSLLLGFMFFFPLPFHHLPYSPLLFVCLPSLPNEEHNLPESFALFSAVISSAPRTTPRTHWVLPRGAQRGATRWRLAFHGCALLQEVLLSPHSLTPARPTDADQPLGPRSQGACSYDSGRDLPCPPTPIQARCQEMPTVCCS